MSSELHARGSLHMKKRKRKKSIKIESEDSSSQLHASNVLTYEKKRKKN
jgi:hypothetical protein